MKLTSVVTAATLALAAGGAFAEDFNVPVTFDIGASGGYAAGLNVTHLEAGSFTDTFSFTPALNGQATATASVITIAQSTDSPWSNIDFTSATLNGNALMLMAMGPTETAFLLPTSVSGALTLVVTGTAGAGLEAGSSISASYAGTLNAIPEPSTLALALAGIGVVGMAVRRRRRDA